MNIGVYITLLNDEYLIPYSFAAIHRFFPEVKVLDFGSEDSSCKLVPKGNLIKCGQQSPKDYISLKNEFSDKHDQVFWVDADEIYPESSLRKIQTLLGTKRERIVGEWRSVLVHPDCTISIEKPFIRGVVAWKTDTNHLYRDWPGEHLKHIDPDWRESKKWRRDHIWCWHGVLLNRSSIREATNRYKKRVHRHYESKVRDAKHRINVKGGKRNYRMRGTWSRYDWIPWGDADVKKYIPTRHE